MKSLNFVTATDVKDTRKEQFSYLAIEQFFYHVKETIHIIYIPLYAQKISWIIAFGLNYLALN